MIITSQGFGHYVDGLNNQDFGIETSRALLILDGCSGAKYSEVGTRMFAQLLTRKEEWDNVEKFEDNVKEVFRDLIYGVKKYYQTSMELEEKFTMENLLFTIIACFDVGDKFIVKLFGDGYIVTQNKQGLISYAKYSYGKCPPYYAYKFCTNLQIPDNFKKNEFKTKIFDKKRFPKVGIGTDGIQPIVKGEINGFDSFVIRNNKAAAETAIKGNKQKFYDDVTFGIIGGEEDGHFK